MIRSIRFGEFWVLQVTSPANHFHLCPTTGVVSSASERTTWDSFSILADKFQSYPPQRLGQAFPNLPLTPHAEDLAALFLQLDPRKRISACEAMHHVFFSVLPGAVYHLPASEFLPLRQWVTFDNRFSCLSDASIFTIDKIKLSPETGAAVSFCNKVVRKCR